MTVDDQQTVGISKPEIIVKPPSLYQVILLNDDFTPREFVVGILKKFFSMDDAMADHTMLTAHIKDHAPCGVFTKDIAETKIDGVHRVVSENKYPLHFIAEAI